MSIATLKARIEKLAAARELEIARASARPPATLWLPLNGHDFGTPGPALRLFDPRKYQAARDAGVEHLAAMDVSASN